MIHVVPTLSALSPVHTSDNVEATFDFVAKYGNNVERVYRKISYFRRRGNVASSLLPFSATMLPISATMFNYFRLYQKDEISFDIVTKTSNIVAENGNNDEATFPLRRKYEILR